MIGFIWYVLQNSVRLKGYYVVIQPWQSKLILGMIDAFFLTICIFMGLD